MDYKDKVYYNCSSYIRKKKCNSHSISKEKLEFLIKEDYNKNNKTKLSDISVQFLIDNIEYISVISKYEINIKYKNNKEEN